MSRAKGATTTSSTTSPARVKKDLLARLGLRAEADDQEVEATHDQIVDYLEGAPSDIRGWADRRQQEVDRIFALLTGPESDLAALARPASQRTAASPVQALRSNRVLLGVIAVLVTIGVVVGVYWMGKPSVPEMTAAQDTAQSQPVLDQAKLAELTKKVEANPKDVASLQGIADLYFNAQDWANAKVWSQKVIDTDAKNQQGYISLGAAAYNGGDNATAEATWKKGVALFPKNAELHYDLGFLYMTTGRSALMKSEWDQVIAIDPNSELAKTVQSQVGAVATPSAKPTK
jgi:tetratricopeptide (TPR) repeat protein